MSASKQEQAKSWEVYVLRYGLGQVGNFCDKNTIENKYLLTLLKLLRFLKLLKLLKHLK